MTPTEYYTKILERVTGIHYDVARYDRGYDYVPPAIDALIDTIKLHEPKFTYPSGIPAGTCPRCFGCDLGPHPEDSPDAPCTTLDTIAQKLGVER
jgi:hypothetical protein